MSDTSPGLKFEERAGVAATLRASAFNTYGLVGTAPRGPAKALLTSWEDFERKFGGFHGDDIGPLSAWGFFAEGGQYLLYSRIKNGDARHGSRTILDAAGKAMLRAVTRWETGQQDVSLSFAKIVTQTAMKISARAALTATHVAIDQSDKTYTRDVGSWVTDGFEVGQAIWVAGGDNNDANGLKTVANVSATVLTVNETVGADDASNSATMSFETIGFEVDDVTGLEPGDVLCLDPTVSANASLVISSVDPETSMVYVHLTGASLTSAPIASGTVVGTSTRHRLVTAPAGTTLSTSTTIVLGSTNGLKVGSVLLLLPPENNADQATATAPICKTVTGISGSTVTLDSAIGGSNDLSSAWKVVSVEFDVTVKSAGAVKEVYRYLTSSSTHPSDYVQDRLGPGVSFEDGAVLTTATGNIADNAESVALTSVSGIAVGDWLKFTESSNSLYLQVKSISSLTVYVDNVGNIPSTLTTPTVTAATPSIADSDSNKSNFVVLDNVGFFTDNDQSSAMHLRTPYPYVDVALTGGVYGSDPDTVAEIKGTSTSGSRSGVYAFEDADEFRQMVAFAIPGLLDTDTGSPSRQSLDIAIDAWAADKGPRYVTSVPSTITQPLDAKAYRQNKLSLQSSYTSLYFSQGKIYDPRDPRRILEVPVDGWMLGLMARRSNARGIHVPPANIPFTTIFDLTVKCSSAEHALLNEAGVNVLVKKKGQGVKPMGARTLLNADGTMRHFINARDWLTFLRRTLEDNLEGMLFEPANTSIYEDLRTPIVRFLASQVGQGVFASSSPSAAFFVKVGSETTSAQDLANGDVYVHIGVALAGATERINFVLLGYEGTVNGVQEV